MIRAYHRGAVVQPQIFFKGTQLHWDPPLRAPSKQWQVEGRWREARNAMYPTTMEQYGRSSYRRRQQRRGPIVRFGRNP